MMHMTFYWSKNVTLLIDSWRTDSWLSYVLSLVACIVASVFYQYLENRRIRLKLLAAGKSSPATTAEIQVPLLRRKVIGGVRVGGAVLFGLSSAIGYLLMLAVMSFNGGVFVAIVVGLAFGHFVFRSEGEEGSLVVDSSCACA
ncbi:PREDICTED: copper transporter 5.1 [Lupinus angustifolius]|uniref:copper transporter 5.1 n=1 Tax=Lupinus angustifolius TaxID=3871 RepID=UPI00092E55C6|nr:PREDICTED: copper transporter 5.1 [Lupinus angustifolius]